MTARRRDTTQLEMFLLIDGLASETVPKAIPAPKVDIDALFREFYAGFPRKREPDAARKAFEKALKRGTFDEIMLGASRYAEECRRSGTRYVKYPATWLNKGCWRDEPDAAPTNSTTASFARIGLEFRAAGGVRR